MEFVGVGDYGWRIRMETVDYAMEIVEGGGRCSWV